MIDKSKWPFTDTDLVLHDLGHDMWWTRTNDHEGNWVGILEWHQCKGHFEELSAGGVYFENAPTDWKGARWKLESEDPLTISPSVLCRACGNHGWIRDGRWVPA